LKILALLIGLFVSHHWPRFDPWRDYRWLKRIPAWCSGRGPDWLPGVASVVFTLLAGGVLTLLAEEMAGRFGLLLLGVAAVLYTIGPRALDADIEQASRPEASERRELARERLVLPDGADSAAAAAAALHAALARWFGVVFWFALLGPAGCLLYRAVRESHRDSRLAPAERAWLGRLTGWLNWPVMLGLTLALALMTDFDRVLTTYRARADRWQLPAALLDDLARTLCDAGGDVAQGLADGRTLAWRALTLWLVVLSLMLLIGWMQ